jgi:hypothetical protein
MWVTPSVGHRPIDGVLAARRLVELLAWVLRSQRLTRARSTRVVVARAAVVETRKVNWHNPVIKTRPGPEPWNEMVV